MKKNLLLICIILLNANGFSQKDSLEEISIGNKYRYYSKELEEERELWISLPESYYTDTTKKFPVVYLLDGASHFVFMTGLLRKFVDKGIPPTILVGIINTKRGRDFIPPSQNIDEDNSVPRAGGADNFIKMLSEDLLPYVEENFRTKDFNTLIGHSLGGLFITYTLVKKPELFNSYVAISPSLWWNGQKAVDMFEKSLEENPDIKGILFMTIGNERGKMLGGMMKLVGILESAQPQNLRWDYKVHPDETHGTISNISEIEGLEFIYKDWIVPNPHLDFLNGGFTIFDNRSKRIQNEFGEERKLDNYKMFTIVYNLNKTGNYKSAIEVGEQLLPKNKYNALLYCALGESYLDNGDTTIAKKYFSTAYKLTPGDKYCIKVVNSLNIDKQKLIPDVKLSKSYLQKITGQYEYSNGIIKIITQSDSVIYNQSGFSKNVYVKPLDKYGHFYFPKDGFSLEFIFDDKNDKAIKVIKRDQLGKETEANRYEGQ